MRSLRLFSLEDNNESVSTSDQETEITIFAKINNFEGLKQAKSSEDQIQVESRLGEANHCRVRQTTKNGQKDFKFTFKINNGNHASNVDSRREQNVSVDENFFNDFLSIADKVQDKTRYFFDSETITLSYREHEEDREIQVPGIIYEVDIFKRPDGSLSDYCKIDIEVDKILVFMEHNYPEIKDIKLNVKISTLPFEPSNGVVNNREDQNVCSFVSHLYDTEFTTNLIEQRQSSKQNE